MTDAELAELIRTNCHSGDRETDHVEADDRIIELLTRLGWNETVAAWREVRKWYA